jgi:CelD/BcsL family acetyltransferase involved in cellulose biosynthesis
MAGQATIAGGPQPPATRFMHPSAQTSPTAPEAMLPSGSLAATVAPVTDESGFAALRPAWNAVAAQRPDLSVFARHEWFDAAWQWRRDSAKLNVLTWSERGQVRAILPMVARSVTGLAGNVRELSFLTVPDTQICDMLVASPDRARAAQAFAAYLAARRHDWVAMRLAYLRPDSTVATALAPALAVAGCAVATAATPGNPFISLRGDWAAYYAGRSRRLKKANNLAANRLAKAGDVRIDWLEPGVPDAGRLAEFVEGIVEISRNSWKEETGTTLDRPGPGAFIRRLSALASERGWLSLWILALDGRPLAMEYQLVHDGNVHALRSDFRRGHEEISPGSHLSRTMLERLFARGYTRYYMGPGNNAYKYRWAEDADPQVAVTLYSSSLAGRVLGTWERRMKPRLSALRARLAKSPPSAAETTED